MSTLAQDFSFAIRTLRKRWMITLLAVFSLGLAIGGNAAVFSMVDAFIFRPLPYPEADRVVIVGERQKDQPEFSGAFSMSIATYPDYEARSRTVAEWSLMQPRTVSLRGPDRSEAIGAAAVTPSFFRLMQARPTRGRLFSDAEAVEGGPKVVLLAEEYSIRTYGEGHDPIGEVLVLNGEPHEVIGVLPEDFEFLTANQDLWLPLQRSPQSAARDQRDAIAVGRLRDGVTMEQVRAEMTGIANTIETEFAEFERGWTVDTYNLRYDIPTRQGRLLFALLQGSVVLVLIIACVNITNLLLARGQERKGEIALRTVLGAGRGRIVRQLLTESSLMVLVGSGLGLAIASVGIRAMANQFAGRLPPSFDLQLDGRVLIFTAGISVAAGLLFGLVPALQTFKDAHAETLKEGSGRGGSGRGKKTLTRVLVIGEIALSFVALGGGSLLVRSFLEIQSSDPGFEPGPILTAVVAIPASKLPDEADRVLFSEQVLERAGRIAGVESAALASTLPQTPLATSDTFRVSGAVVDAGAPTPRAIIVQASPEYLRTMGIGLLQGRFFESSDRLETAPVVVVNRKLAELRFGNGSALGRRLDVRGESREIVGVAEDVQQVLLQTGPASSGETVYLPVAQEPKGANFLVLRTRGDPLEAAEPLRGALQDLDRDLTVSQTKTMEQFVAQFFVGISIFNTVLTGFGLVALLLASLGTYGVLSYSVTQRKHEIGIRMALGAESGTVVKMVARQGFWLGVTGLVLGGLMTLPLVGLLNTLLQGLSTIQPATLIVIAAVLFGVTLVASLVPAGRAAAVDPMRTLRNE
jgi:putative ABC transport system permease protein